jgi:hypothetical protein
LGRSPAILSIRLRGLPVTWLIMPTPFESAQLNLQLFDLRREAVLREARAWFLRDFNPESFTELIAILSGRRNAAFRMVLGYWDMAASLVTTGAIDGDAFRAAHGEIFGTFSKIQLHLAELRAASGEPDFCKYMEAVVLAAPDAEGILSRRREALRAAAKAGTSNEGEDGASSNGPRPARAPA